MEQLEYPKLRLGKLSFEFPGLTMEPAPVTAAHMMVYPELSLINITWQAHMQGTALRQAFVESVQIAHRQQLQYWYADARNLRYLLFEDQNWLAKELPKIIAQTAIRRMALVVEADSFMLVSSSVLEQTLAQSGQQNCPTIFELFDSEALAKYWLFEYTVATRQISAA